MYSNAKATPPIKGILGAALAPLFEGFEEFRFSRYSAEPFVGAEISAFPIPVSVPRTETGI